MSALEEAELVEPPTLADWGSWLAAHHADRAGAWLVIAKKSTGRQAFDYDAAVVEALRFGWVDAVQRKLDDERSMLWFAPRRPRSGWSRPNKIRLERLEREGRLEAAGRAAVEVAKGNGGWGLLDEVEDLVVPDDLADAFAALPEARDNWDAFPPSARRGMLEWVVQAKRAETRERRVCEIAEKAARGIRAR